MYIDTLILIIQIGAPYVGYSGVRSVDEPVPTEWYLAQNCSENEWAMQYL